MKILLALFIFSAGCLCAASGLQAAYVGWLFLMAALKEILP